MMNCGHHKFTQKISKRKRKHVVNATRDMRTNIFTFMNENVGKKGELNANQREEMKRSIARIKQRLSGK